MNILKYALSKYPIIVSLIDSADLDKALRAESGIIILIQADINTLADIANKIKDTEKLIFVHMDLIKGLKRDPSGIQFLADHIGIDGIVTTHGNLIQSAKKFNLLTIQRVFILDSASIRQGIKSIQDSRPDAVEILPGIAVPHIKEEVQINIKPLVIVARFINTEYDIINVLKNGAHGVSSSSTDVWNVSSIINDKLIKNSTHSKVIVDLNHMKSFSTPSTTVFLILRLFL